MAKQRYSRAPESDLKVEDYDLVVTGSLTVPTIDDGNEDSQEENSIGIKEGALAFFNGSVWVLISDGSDKIDISEKGEPLGVATLGADGKLTNSQVSSIAITDTFEVASQSAMLALSSADIGDIAIRSDISKTFILAATPPSTLANWKELKTPTDAVTSVNGFTGAITLAALTATNATLVFSGSFNGGTARTVGLNLANANTWTAAQTINVASGTALALTGTGTGVLTVGTGRIASSGNNLVLAGASGDASLRAVTGGQLEIPAGAGATDAILYANVNGLVGRLGVGTGLSMSGGVLSATGGGSGTIGGSGTTGRIPVFSGSGSIANGSLSDNSSGLVTINGAAGTFRVGTNSGDYGTLVYSGGTFGVYNNWASTSAQSDLFANGVGIRVFGTGNAMVGYTTDQGVKLGVNGSASVNGTVTGTSFSGAGTGLTGTASGLNIGGNAATATTATTATNANNATTWASQSYSGSSPATIQYAMVYDNTNAQFRIANATQLGSFLGLGNYAPLASPALTGSPTAPTQSPGDNSTKIATTAYADAVAAGSGVRVINVTGTRTLNISDWSNSTTLLVTVETALSPFTLTLPLASTWGTRRLIIKKTDSSTNLLTISRSGSDTIEGNTSDTANTQWAGVEYVSNGSTLILKVSAVP